MKYLPILILLFSFNAYAQSIQDCANARLLECDRTYQEINGYLGPGIVPNEIPPLGSLGNPGPGNIPPSTNAGCLQAFPPDLNASFYTFTIKANGTLSWVLDPLPGSPLFTCYDWALYSVNPNSPDPCADIRNNLVPPVRCNWNAPCAGLTGMATPAVYGLVGGNPGNFEAPYPVTAGMKFILVLSNFSGSAIGFNLNFGISTVIADTLGTFFNDTVATVKCYDNKIRFKTKRMFYCNTLDSIGSEFRLIDSLGLGYPIQSARVLYCDSSDRTDSVEVTFSSPFVREQSFYLVTKKGFDGDVARDFCEKEFRELDSLKIIIDSCYKYTTPPILLNVSVNENTSVDITWADPNPAVDTTFFESYEIYKNLGSGTPTPQFPITRIFDYTVRTWNDVDVTPPTDSYNYALAIKLKPLGANFVTDKSDSISSIHLQVDPPANPDDEQLNLTWTPYWGWLNELYRLEQRTATDWIQVDSTFGTSLVYTKPTTPGDYTLRIRTTVQTPIALTSLSNWITFGVPEIIIPVRPIKIPNVITPNGDGINDFFVIDNLEDYPNSTLKIINRWGGMIFSSENYNNEWNGDGVSPGIYYYILTLKNGEEFKGSLRIIR